MMPSKTNIAVVVFDTMRADTFESHFSWLIDRGVSFNNAWSTSHWTIPAHASLFTGLHASEVGTHSKNRKLRDTGTNLAVQLSEAGYTTRGLTANWTVAPEWDFDRGFEDYRYALNQSDWKDLIRDEHIVSRYPAFLIRALTAKDSIQVLQEGLREAVSETWFSRYLDSGARRIHATIQRLSFESPEFLFLNFMEVHSPYSPPAAYLSGKPASLHSFRDTANGPSDDPTVIRTAYNNAARYLSDQYREIHATLEEHFDIIITISDHGDPSVNTVSGDIHPHSIQR